MRTLNDPSEWDEICDLCNKWGLHSEEACEATLRTKYTTEYITDSMRFMFQQGYNLAKELKQKKNGNT